MAAPTLRTASLWFGPGATRDPCTNCLGHLLTGAVAATSCECGKCEYPLLRSPTKIAEDGTEELICEMCGSAYDIETGTERPSTGGGNALLAPILRNKPQKPLKVFPAREVDDGRVFVNITPITPK